mgnify:CR=1 FL=1
MVTIEYAGTPKPSPADEKERVIAYWTRFPYAKTSVVAGACKVDRNLPVRFYPFPRYGVSFRVDQALRWFDENCGANTRRDKDIGNAALLRRYGFSGGVLADARKIRKMAARKRMTVEQAATYYKASPEGRVAIDAALSGKPIPDVTPTPEQVAVRQDTPVAASPIEHAGDLAEEIARLQREPSQGEEGGQRDNHGKPRHDLIAPEMLDGVAAVLAFGAKKYGERDWEKGLLWGGTLASTMRHLMVWMQREELDEESGLPHLDHAACNIMFLCAFARRGIGTDSRG